MSEILANPSTYYFRLWIRLSTCLADLRQYWIFRQNIQENGQDFLHEATVPCKFRIEYRHRMVDRPDHRLRGHGYTSSSVNIGSPKSSHS